MFDLFVSIISAGYRFTSMKQAAMKIMVASAMLNSASDQVLDSVGYEAVRAEKLATDIDAELRYLCSRDDMMWEAAWAWENREVISEEESINRQGSQWNREQQATGEGEGGSWYDSIKEEVKADIRAGYGDNINNWVAEALTQAEWEAEAFLAQFDDDPSPYDGTYSEC